MGYDEWNWRCYRIYKPDTNSVRLSVHVTFDESSFPTPEAIMESDEFVEMPIVGMPGGDVLDSPGAHPGGDRVEINRHKRIKHQRQEFHFYLGVPGSWMERQQLDLVGKVMTKHQQ